HYCFAHTIIGIKDYISLFLNISTYTLIFTLSLHDALPIYPPFPTAARAHALGRAVADAVASYPPDMRVGALASGSISHEVGGPRVNPGEFWAVPDPRWVETVTERLRAGETATLVEEATDERLDAAGNVAHELLTIVALLGAVGDRPATQLETDERLGHAFGAWRL